MKTHQLPFCGEQKSLPLTETDFCVQQIRSAPVQKPQSTRGRTLSIIFTCERLNVSLKVFRVSFQNNYITRFLPREGIGSLESDVSI